MSRAALACACALLLAAASGCAGDEDEDRGAPAKARRADRPSRDAPVRAPLRRARCPAELSNCRTASGRVLYVERVDPDGDGDAHFVLDSPQAITLPGLSIIDVRKSLRPHPLPGPGDRVSAAGPVYRGSFGQRQIEAIELHVAR